MTEPVEIDPSAVPSGTGCADCLAGDGPGWWLQLRRCAACGHVGCCDSSPSQHAQGHFTDSGHPVMQSFEPGDDWFWHYGRADYVQGPALAEPTSHPAEQPVPGPAGAVPEDWQQHLN